MVLSCVDLAKGKPETDFWPFLVKAPRCRIRWVASETRGSSTSFQEPSPNQPADSRGRRCLGESLTLYHRTQLGFLRTHPAFPWSLSPPVLYLCDIRKRRLGNEKLDFTETGLPFFIRTQRVTRPANPQAIAGEGEHIPQPEKKSSFRSQALEAVRVFTPPLCDYIVCVTLPDALLLPGSWSITNPCTTTLLAHQLTVFDNLLRRSRCQSYSSGKRRGKSVFPPLIMASRRH